MSLLGYLSSSYKKIGKSIGDYIRDPKLSEAELLHQEIERRDRENPGWNYKANLAALKSQLRGDPDLELLTNLYGKDMIKEAQSQLEKEARKPYETER